ncbi:MAG: 50S ribosomal protein L6 [Planctomycetota bacterium]|nr:MAG: 50S ribosomal protein L6 [Planctomycetota bacterium]REK30130.1 MAG: 50S ribosomal protein L6 [Planctomycetota bacterium]REK37762.1 MAG: 50S ribosomal protein L6 [Planctomycetota bacterium]
MSRIGKQPIPIASGVDVAVENGTIRVKGPQGELSFTHHPKVSVSVDEQDKSVRVERPNDQRETRALHGLTRALIANMVQGVQTPYVKKLEIEGVGYQASLNGKELALQVGYANTIRLQVPDLVDCELPSATQIVVKSIDKHAVGQFAANIRQVRPVEPYKGKGIRYSDERVRRKAGKAFAGG